MPFANIGLVRVPDDIRNGDAVVLSDILPTGYFGAELARIKSGNTVAVFGCGPVGLFAIKSAFLMGASQVFAVDKVTARLEIARSFGAEIIDFESEDPIEAILELTGGIGADRVIDAVGIDADHPHSGPAFEHEKDQVSEFDEQLKQVAPEAHPEGPVWKPGDGPGQVMNWAVEAIAKAGTMSIIGVYPETVRFFPLGKVMNKNLKINMGNCNHRRYIPMLMDMIQEGEIRPQEVISHIETLTGAIDAYKAFDQRREGWVKVELLAPGI